MKIEFVERPIEEYPWIEGAYDCPTKRILIKKGLSPLNTMWTILHEIGHYLFDLLPLTIKQKYRLHLIYDLIYTILFIEIRLIRNTYQWVRDYYKGTY